MSSTAAPFGLRPIQDRSGNNVCAICYPNGIQSGYATALYQYTPVVLATATINGQSVNTLTVAAVNADFLGSLDGVEWVDSNGRMQFSKMWQASLAPLAGSVWNVYVWDDPRQVFEIQSNGILPIAAQTTAGQPFYGMVGQQADFAATPGSGSSTTQTSSAALDNAQTSSSGQKQLRIINKAFYVDNDWNDAFPIVQVQNARHQYIANKVAV